MKDASQSSPEHDHHVRRVRGLSILSLVLILFPLWWVLLEQPVAVIALAPPFVVPACVVLLLLPGDRVGLALMLARDMGAVLGAGALLMIAVVLSGWPSGWVWPWAFVVGLSALMVVYAALLVNARRAVVRGWLPKRNHPLTAVGLMAACAFFLALFVIWTFPHWARSAGNEHATQNAMRTFHRATSTYAELYGNGFPVHLRLLGSTVTRPDNEGRWNCVNAGLIDDDWRLEDGLNFRRFGYLFEYRPGLSLDGASAGCPPGVWTYTLSARPLTWNTTGRSSFLMDQSGQIHSTSSNRDASPADPVLRRGGGMGGRQAGLGRRGP